MNVLFLGSPKSSIVSFLRDQGESVVVYEEKIDADFVASGSFEFIVSFGYRHIIKKDIIDLFSLKIINLHISYLPWNRGADPNFWSFVENTPKGVTIHLVDEGLDSGAILFQKEVQMSSEDTLRTSYEKLVSEICAMFSAKWPLIKSGQCQPRPQVMGGSFHRTQDRKSLEFLLEPKQFDTPVGNLENYSRSNS